MKLALTYIVIFLRDPYAEIRKQHKSLVCSQYYTSREPMTLSIHYPFPFFQLNVRTKLFNVHIYIYILFFWYLLFMKDNHWWMTISLFVNMGNMKCLPCVLQINYLWTIFKYCIIYYTYHLIYHIIFHIIYHIISRHITSYHIIPYYINHSISNHIISYIILSYTISNLSLTILPSKPYHVKLPILYRISQMTSLFHSY